jgi:hypothetical protein
MYTKKKMKKLIKKFIKRFKSEPIPVDMFDYQSITEKDIPEDAKGCDFRMSAVEYARYKKFQENHKECMRRPDGMPRYGAIGGGIVVSCIGTGLGNIWHVKCQTCGTEVCITDNSNW